MYVQHHRIVTLQNGVNPKADHLHYGDATETSFSLPRSSAFSLASRHDPRAMLLPHYTVESNQSILHWSAHCAWEVCWRNVHRGRLYGVEKENTPEKTFEGGMRRKSLQL